MLPTIKWLNIWQVLLELLDLVTDVSKVTNEKCIILILKEAMLEELETLKPRDKSSNQMHAWII